MRYAPVREEFIETLAMSWRDLAYGWDHGWLGIQSLIRAAERSISDNTAAEALEVKLASLSKSQAAEAAVLLQGLAAQEAEAVEEELQAKWLYLLLRQVYEDRHEMDDPLGVVDEVYTDLGYPAEVASFIRYMPTRDDVPYPETKDESDRRLISKWAEFLQNAANQYAAER